MAPFSLILLTTALFAVANPKSEPKEILHAAETNDTLTLVNWLDAGGNPNAVGEWDYSLIHRTMYLGKDAADAARLLLDRGANIDTRCEGTPLIQQAILTNSPRCLRLFIERGAPRNQIDEFGYLPLHCAAAFGRIEAIKILLEAGEVIDKTDNKGRTPLLCAWEAKWTWGTERHLDEEEHWNAAGAFVYLLERGAASRVVNWNSFEPLQRAAQFNVPRLVYELARRGFNVAHMRSHGQTGLHVAARFGHYGIAKLLIDCGADVDARCWPFVPTPLYYACKKNSPEIVKLLIEHGADVNQSYFGTFYPHKTEYQFWGSPLVMIIGAMETPKAVTYHPLMVAAESDASEIVDLLIRNGTDVDQKDSKGRTPLEIALLKGSARAAKTLIDNGADLGHLDKAKSQYLARIVSKDYSADVTERLLDAGFQVNAPCSDSYSPVEAYGRLLIIAADGASPANVKLLIERGADVKALNSNGWTALHLAAFRGSLESVRALLGAGAEVDATTEKPDQRSALGIAAEKGDAGIVKLLLDYGARVGYETIKSGVRSKNVEVVRQLFDSRRFECSVDGLNNLLFEATKRNTLEIVKLMLEEGADINAINVDGVSVLHYALRLKWMEGAQYLLLRNAKVNTHDKYMFSPLSEAFLMQDLALMKVILDRGGDPNDRARLPVENSPQWPIIRHYIESNDTAGVKLLIKYGVGIDAWTINNAILKKREWILDRLLDEVANPNRKWFGKRRTLDEILGPSVALNAYDEFDPQTPLAMAVMGGNLPLVKRLVEMGGRVNFGDSNKITVLHRAVLCGDIEIARYLLAMGANVNLKDYRGRTPLAWTVRQKNPPIAGTMTEAERVAMAKLLVEHGAMVNITVQPDHESEIYSLPLISAVIKDHSIENLKLLIEHGADVNVADPYENRPLHTAIKLGKKEAIPLLISAGANPKTLNGERRSAFGMAEEMGAKDILEMLKGKASKSNQ